MKRTNDDKDRKNWEGLFKISKIKRNLKVEGWEVHWDGISKIVDGIEFYVGYSDSWNGKFIIDVRLRPEKQLRKKVAGRDNKYYNPTVKILNVLSDEVEKVLKKSQADDKFVKEYKLFKRLEKTYGGF